MMFMVSLLHHLFMITIKKRPSLFQMERPIFQLVLILLVLTTKYYREEMPSLYLPIKYL